jgi:hypothetical protein
MNTNQDIVQRCPRKMSVAVENRMNNTTKLHVCHYIRYVIMLKAGMLVFLN